MTLTSIIWENVIYSLKSDLPPFFVSIVLFTFYFIYIDRIFSQSYKHYYVSVNKDFLKNAAVFALIGSISCIIIDLPLIFYGSLLKKTIFILSILLVIVIQYRIITNIRSRTDTYISQRIWLSTLTNFVLCFLAYKYPFGFLPLSSFILLYLKNYKVAIFIKPIISTPRTHSPNYTNYNTSSTSTNVRRDLNKYEKEDLVRKIKLIMHEAQSIPHHRSCTGFGCVIRTSMDEYLKNEYWDDSFPTDKNRLHVYKAIKYSNFLYLGDVRNFQRHGFGFALYNNGDLYAGLWKFNLKNDGEGIYFSDSPKTIIIGEFEDDVLEGKGRQYQMRTKAEFSGYYKNWKLVSLESDSDKSTELAGGWYERPSQY